MEIRILPLGHLQTNCYLISGKKGAVVIDPGFISDETERFLNENKEKETLILLTHAHFDHIGGAVDLREKTKTKIAIGKNDAESLKNPDINLSSRFRAKFGPFGADFLLEDGQEITVGDLCFKVIFTPGHTIGSVSFLSGDLLFSGDTLFLESVGRTDFPGGNMKTLMESLKKLFTLPENTVVYPGHGESTYILHEKKFNPFARF